MTIKAKNKKGITKIKTNRTKILKVLKERKMIKMKIKQNNKIMMKFLKVLKARKMMVLDKEGIDKIKKSRKIMTKMLSSQK